VWTGQVQALQAKLGLLAAQVGDWEGNAMYNDGARKNLSKLSGDELQTLEHKQLAQLYQTQVAKVRFTQQLRLPRSSCLTQLLGNDAHIAGRTES